MSEFSDALGKQSGSRTDNVHDPLLIASQVLLIVLLVGVIIAAVGVLIGLAAQFTSFGIPRSAPWGPEWRPISDLVFALGALWIIADITITLLAMIRTVGRGTAFERANVARLQRIAHNVIGLAVLGVIAEISGSFIGGEINGVDVAVDLPASIGFALLMFILARVFRQGAAMHEELEGTV